MLVTTTPYIDGKKVVEYKTVVTGETIAGVNLFRDFFAGIRDIFGGRSKGYEKGLEKARNQAMDDMVSKANAVGANAVIGIDVDYETVGKSGSMLLVAISGTAVVIQ